MSTKHRSYVFTWNNPDEPLEVLGDRFKSQSDHIKFGVVGFEVAPTTNTPHFQGYIQFHNSRAIKNVNRIFFNNKAHLEPARGTPRENYEYCIKEGVYFTIGDIPSQGKRTDIDDIKTLIFDHGMRVRDLVRNDKIQNSQQLKFAESLSKYKPVKERIPPKVYWFYGATGTGKTKTAFELCDPEDTWKSSGALRWFEGYDEHKHVILDDFRYDHCSFSFLLNLLDRYNMKVEIKGGTVNWVPEMIIITCPVAPEVLFERYDGGDNVNQLLRRITEIRCFDIEISPVRPTRARKLPDIPK